MWCNQVNDTHQAVDFHTYAWSSGTDVPLRCAIAYAFGGACSHLPRATIYNHDAGSPSLAPTWNPLLGKRVGEASNPGPRAQSSFYMNITVANITKLRKHKQATISLWEEKPGILCLTETSADQHTERIVTKQVRQAGGTFLAGKSCSRSEDLKQDDPATRTFFGGVATISVPQARLCTDMIATPEWQSTRYLEVVSRINHIQILSPWPGEVQLSLLPISTRMPPKHIFGPFSKWLAGWRRTRMLVCLGNPHCQPSASRLRLTLCLSRHVWPVQSARSRPSVLSLFPVTTLFRLSLTLGRSNLSDRRGRCLKS